MINNNRLNTRAQSGLTLIELMIAMSITVFMMAGVLGVYTSSKQAYRVQNNASKLQENGRFALDYLAKNIRMAGYVGCLPVTNVKGDAISQDNAFSIYEYNGTDWSNDLIGTSTHVKPNTDILILKRAEVFEYPLLSDMTSKSDSISISGSNHLEDGDVVLISGCRSVETFEISNITSGVITHSNPLEARYKVEDNPVIMKLSSSIYYIKDKGNGTYSLYKRTASTDEEMVEGVDDMQFDKPDDDIDSIRISLLMRSLEDGITGKKGKPIQFNGNTVTVTDKYLRKTYSMLVKQRN